MENEINEIEKEVADSAVAYSAADIADTADSTSEEDSEISFEDLGLDEATLRAVEKKGFKVPSPIQVLAIPRLLDGDANIIAKARTGTGKTAAFGLPIVQKIRGKGADCVRALVLEPTRELAIQTCTELQSFGDGSFPRVAVLYGGASYSTQIKDLKRGVEIVVGTPGRIKDHLERGTLKLDKIDYFILDEGDEMLDMGFVEDIEEIFSKANPASRILLFSATMPKPILKIAETFMGEYDICEEEGFVEEPLLIDQKYWVVREGEKIEALVRLIDMADDFYGLVFTQTKNDADTVTRLLDERGYEVAALHGDIPQAQREKILARFRSRKTRVLVATDVAARGIDISGLSHVVNYSLPFDSATYIHRIGRTGRAGTSGVAVTFVRPEEARRKLAFLQNAVKRAAKGEMLEGQIPSVEDVLSAKRGRMLSSLKEQLASFETSEVDSVYTDMAHSLCEEKDAEKVLAGVLSAWYGKTLNASHYGKITPVHSPRRDGRRDANGRRDRFDSSPRADQKRLFVQLGKRDGFFARDIAEYFSSLLHIPGRLVDQIEVTQNFSLVSLPVNAADRVLEMARRDSSIPHVHVDSKAGSDREDSYDDERGFGRRRGGFGRGEGRGGFGGGSRFGRRGERGERSERRGDRGGFKSDHARKNVHTPTERVGASAYKKTAKREV